jgi:uncharacterized protein (TIGR02246 family)
MVQSPWGVAACWTTAGDFTGPEGERAEGAQNIEKAFREFFAASPNRNLKLHVTSVRIASEGLALVDTISEVTPATTEDAGVTRLSLVLVNRDGRWQIESAHETATYASSPGQHLKDLDWMVGEWADNISPQNGRSLQSTCDWTANRAFLIRKFKVEGRADVSRTGTEIIGWDPRAGRIRSWVFDSDGSFGENAWVRDGNRWLVRYSGTRPDGTDASATNVLTVVDANTVTIKSKDRTANGAGQPEVPEVTIKRQQVAKDDVKPKEPVKSQEQVLP